LILAGIRLPKSTKREYFAGKNVTSRRVRDALIALTAQYIAADKEGYFSLPNPKYTSVAMSFKTLKSELEKEKLSIPPSQIFENFRRKLRAIWAGALEFNNDNTREFQVATWFNQATTKVLEITARALSIDEDVIPEIDAPAFEHIKQTFTPARERTNPLSSENTSISVSYGDTNKRRKLSESNGDENAVEEVSGVDVLEVEDEADDTNESINELRKKLVQANKKIRSFGQSS